MGIFLNNPMFLREFEVDGQKSDDGVKEDDYNVDAEGGEDTGGESGNDNNNENNNEEGTKEEDYDMGGNDENEEDEGEGDDEQEDGDDNGVNEDDYTIEDDNEEDDEEEDADGTDDDISSNDDDSEDEEMDSKLKDLEGELFDNLSDEQKQIKIDELKKCYQELHDRCDNIISLVNNSNAPDENTSRVFEYLNDVMSDLKQYVYDYFTDTFPTKTYLENDAQYRKYLAVLNSFNIILEELLKKKEKDNEN